MSTYKKITDLSAATTLDGTETFEAVQSAGPKQASMSQVADYVAGASALTSVFASAATVAVTGATLVSTYVFDEDQELDLSSVLTDGQASALTTLTGIPSAAVAVLFYIGLGDSSTTPRLKLKRSSAASAEIVIGGSFADQGTNYIWGNHWIPTDGNSIYVTQVTSDNIIYFYALGYQL